MKKSLSILIAAVLCGIILFSTVVCAAEGGSDPSASSSGEIVSSGETASNGETVSSGETASNGETVSSGETASSGETVTSGETASYGETVSTPGKKVYFAGPLFSHSEKDFNLKITKLLEDHGYEVFLPQRDGYLAAELEGKSEEELIKMIFEKDYGEILNADIIFMNLDGRVPDEGACTELGIAYASGKRCYGFKTDSRSVEIGLDLNPMIAGCFIKYFKNFDGDALIVEIGQYLTENDL